MSDGSLIKDVNKGSVAASYPTTMPAKTISLLRMNSGVYSGAGVAAGSGEDDAAGTWRMKHTSWRPNITDLRDLSVTCIELLETKLQAVAYIQQCQCEHDQPQQ